MPNTHRIDIQSPIWKTRAVGISLMNANPDDIVEMTIAYKKKDGTHPWPHTYWLYAKEIHAYGVKYVKNNVSLYEVPIKDWRKIVTQNQQQTVNKPEVEPNQKAMLFDNKDIDKIRKENKERQGGDFDKRPIIPPGSHVLKISEVKLDYSKQEKHPMVVISYIKDEDHKPINKFYMLAGNGSEMGRSKIVDLLERGFNYIIQPCKSEEDLLKQINQFLGRKIKAAVQHVYEVFDSKKNNECYVSFKPDIWYIGNETDATFSMNPLKNIVPMKPEMIQKITEKQNLGQKINWGPGTREGVSDQPQQISTPEPQQSNDAMAPVKEPVTAEEKKEDDDLPF